MNAELIKAIARWMTITGATLLTGGLGLSFAINRVEASKLKAEITKSNLETKAQKELDLIDAKKQESLAKRISDETYAERVRNMSQSEFAKFHAEKVAKANAEVIADAERRIQSMEAQLAKAKYDAQNAITKVREECVNKIDEANKKREEAEKKYDTLNTLFLNRKEVLDAKRKLDEMAERQKSDKDKTDKLLKLIEEM